MATLHEIWPSGFYCGPSAIAALTGMDCREARAFINVVRGRPANRGVMGMSNAEMVATLISVGLAPRPFRVFNRPTLLAAIASFLPGERYLVELSRHYVTVLDGRVFDNHVRFGIDAAKHPFRRARVKYVWQVN